MAKNEEIEKIIENEYEHVVEDELEFFYNNI